MYETLKVFESYKAPKEIREELHQYICFDLNHNNDTGIKWIVGEEEEDLINGWLLVEGAKENEMVIIYHSW